MTEDTQGQKVYFTSQLLSITNRSQDKNSKEERRTGTDCACPHNLWEFLYALDLLCFEALLPPLLVPFAPTYSGIPEH